jgi:hypothetical protein
MVTMSSSPFLQDCVVALGWPLRRLMRGVSAKASRTVGDLAER